MQNLVSRYYPTVDRLCLLQDNVNTHTPGSFYHVLSPEEAFQFSQIFDPHYTPKKASWLNMAETEFAALSQQCLDRRIADRETLAREAHAWADKRNKAHATVNWTFTKADARRKLQSKYPVLKNSMGR